MNNSNWNSSPVPAPRVLSAALWAAIEDYHGLWEYPGEVRGALELHGSTQPRDRDIAAAVLFALVVDGLIELFWCDEPYGSLTAISASEAQDVLNRDEHWTPPAAGTSGVRIGVTSAGEDAYQRLQHEWTGAAIRPR